MNKKILILWFVIVCLSVSGQTLNGGETVLRKMYVAYFEKPCRSYSFSQKNSHYKNDSIVGKSEWHENVEFPDKFRIVFGAPEDGNKVVFRNDSVFNYRKNELVKNGRDSISLLLILGGMYFRPFEEVVARLNKAGFKTDVMSVQFWNGKAAYVIGAKEGDSTSNQIWVEKKGLNVARIIEKNGASLTDMRFESHQPLCGAFVENKVSFRRNRKLEQVEEYFDIKENVPFD